MMYNLGRAFGTVLGSAAALAATYAMVRLMLIGLDWLTPLPHACLLLEGLVQ